MTENIREQLELLGFDETLRSVEATAASPKEKKVLRRRIEKTYEILTEIPSFEELSFLHSGLCQTCLPHSRPTNNHDVWVRSSGRFRLMIQPGVIDASKENIKDVRSFSTSDSYIGVPYGSKARLILIYLQTEGLKDRTVDLGKTQSAFMRSLGLAITGGPRGNINAVKEQTMRIARCNFVMQWTDMDVNGDERTIITDSRITDGVEFWDKRNGDWAGVIELNQRFHEHLKQHAVPLDKRGIAHLAGNSLGLDLYAFFAYRLPRLSKNLYLNWRQIQNQMGSEFSHPRHLGQRIRETLQDVIAAYPDAKVEVAPRGLILKPSKPAVPKTQVNGFRVLPK